MNTGTQEPGREVYRKLLYFYKHNEPVHFSLLKGGWKNGHVRDLNRRAQSVVLNEFKEGVLIFLCEEIDPQSIEPYRKKPVAAEVRE